MKNTIFSDKFFYHIYPLGLFNCPEHNDFSCPAGNGFEKLSGELPRLKELGVNALYIGPVFESTKHGYDTVDYYNIDRRLGNNEKFADFCKKAHDFGFSIVLDAVFNGVAAGTPQHKVCTAALHAQPSDDTSNPICRLPDEQVCMQAQTTVVCRINGRLGDSPALNEAFQADFSEVK